MGGPQLSCRETGRVIRTSQLQDEKASSHQEEEGTSFLPALGRFWVGEERGWGEVQAD